METRPGSTLNGLQTLATVVDCGNFARAAEQLGINRAAVSKRIQQLEAALGTPVFERSTHKVSITPAGRLLLERYREADALLQAGVEEARAAMTVVSGSVSLSCTSSLAVHWLAPVLCELAARQPQIKLSLRAWPDPGADEADIVLRVTATPPPERAARVLARINWGLCASPAYLAQHGTPQAPADLLQHRFIIPPSYERPGVFRPRAGGEPSTVSPPVLLRSSVQEVVFELVRQGQGIGLLPDYLRRLDHDDERLVSVLPEWVLEHQPAETLYAIHPPAALLRAAVRAVLEHLAQAALTLA